MRSKNRRIAGVPLALLLSAAAPASLPAIGRAQGSEDARSQAAADFLKGVQAGLDDTRASARQIRALGQDDQNAEGWWRKHTEGVPYTGRHRIIFIPAKDANALGSSIYAGMIAKYRAKGLIDDDPQAVARIKRVCDRLIRVADQPQLAWEYHLIDTGTINAFAIAGGKIGVLKGILPLTKDDVGLAVVLGHEVGHVVARHLDERLSEIILLQAAELAGSFALPALLPYLLPAAALHAANVVATIEQIYYLVSYEGTRLGIDGFSRVQEAEADHIGLILMAKAGYDPLLAVDFWKRMSQAFPEPKHPWLARWWRDHPLTKDRIASEEKWAPDIRKQYYHPDPGQPAPAAPADGVASAPGAEPPQPLVVGVDLGPGGR